MSRHHGRSEDNALRLTFDQEADAVYVYFSGEDVDHTDELTEQVNVDYDVKGEPVGVEFLDVSEGIDLDHVPRRRDIAKLLDEGRFRVFA